MSHTFFKKLGVVVLICLIVIAIIFLTRPGTSPQVKPSAKPELTVGAILPLTGTVAFLGEQYKQGMELAAKELNNSNELQIHVLYEDGQADPQKSLAAAQHLLLENHTPILLTALRGATLAIAPALKDKDVVVLGSTATTRKSPITNVSDRFWAIGGEMQTAGNSIGRFAKDANLCCVAGQHLQASKQMQAKTK